MFKVFRLMDEASALEIAQRLRVSERWSQGQARTAQATGTIKHNDEIVPRGDDDPLWPIVNQVREAVLAHRGLMAHTLTYKLTAPKFNRYREGDAYHRHYDASPMSAPDMRTDFSATLFLSPPDTYEGGVLTVESPEGAPIPLPAQKPGMCAVYECGAAHWVTPVTSGERTACIFWLKSMVADPLQRRLLTKFTQTLSDWEREGKALSWTSDEYTTLTGLQTQLARMWIDT